MKYASLATAAIALCAIMATTALAQEAEPNDTCETAQLLDIDALPFELAGELGQLELGLPDIDFFVVTAPPDTFIQVDLQGVASGSGTLGDPLLGLFDFNGCAPRNTDDDGGFGNESRLTFAMPPEGMVVVAATQSPDFGFTAGGFGTYLLRISPLPTIQAISAELIDADTSAPLPGDVDPFANTVLYRCSPDDCFDFIGFQQADSSGRVRYERDYLGNPLTAGQYVLQAGANGYEVAIAGPFAVADGEDFDIGPVALTPMRFIGTLSGRIIDAFDGSSISGTSDPFARVLIERCLDPTFCFVAAFVYADDAGQFSLDARAFGLAPGDYRATAQAENYTPTTTDIVTIGDRENFDFGDIAVTPFPVRLTNVTPCQLPASGGTCTFGAEVINIGPGAFRGRAWAQIDYFGPSGFSRFQVGAHGARNPRPVPVNLPEGRSKELAFRLTLPPSVPVGAFACGTIWLGESPSPEFDLVAQQFAFCVSKTEESVRTMNPRSGRKFLRDKRNDVLQSDLPPRGRFLR